VTACPRDVAVEEPRHLARDHGPSVDPLDRNEIDPDPADLAEPRRISACGAPCTGAQDALLEVAEKAPEHLALPTVDPLERVPRAGGPLHLDEDERPAVGAEREKVGFVAPVAGASPVARDDAHAERAQEPFRRPLAWVARRAGKRETEAMEEIGERHREPIGAQGADGRDGLFQRGRNTITRGRNTITRGRNTITRGRNTITRGRNTITRGRNTITRGRNTITRGRNTITRGRGRAA